MMRLRTHTSRGQTILEYMMVIVIVIIPITAAIRQSIQFPTDNSNQSEEQLAAQGKKRNLLHAIFDDAYGDRNRLGVIGRPYP